MILGSDLVVIAEGEVDQKLAKILNVWMQVAILKLHQILENDLMDDGALVTELHIQLLLILIRWQLVLLRVDLSSLGLGGVDGNQLAVLENIVFENLRAEIKKLLGRFTTVEELLEEDGQVNLQGLLLVS